MKWIEILRTGEHLQTFLKISVLRRDDRSELEENRLIVVFSRRLWLLAKRPIIARTVTKLKAPWNWSADICIWAENLQIYIHRIHWYLNNHIPQCRAGIEYPLLPSRDLLHHIPQGIVNIWYILYRHGSSQVDSYRLWGSVRERNVSQWNPLV